MREGEKLDAVMRQMEILKTELAAAQNNVDKAKSDKDKVLLPIGVSFKAVGFLTLSTV